MVSSLSNGLDSLSARLGADIVVVPYAATSKVSYDSIIIQGKPGQFYMDAKYYDKIKNEIEGIDIKNHGAVFPCFRKGVLLLHPAANHRL